jgi:hypothetical protein
MGLNVLIELHKFGMHGKNMGLNVLIEQHKFGMHGKDIGLNVLTEQHIFRMLSSIYILLVIKCYDLFSMS